MNKDIIRNILFSNDIKNNNILRERQFHKSLINNCEIGINEKEKKEV